MSRLLPGMKNLDTVYSKYIRLKKSIDGVCICCTCGKRSFWNEGMDAGHFISREYWSTRYYEPNVSPQCAQCNRFKSGLQYEHSLYIDRAYGPGTAEEIHFKSKLPSGLDAIKIKALTKKYRALIKEME